MSWAGCASIGSTGCIRRTLNSPSALAPPLNAATATGAMAPAKATARRTTAGRTPGAGEGDGATHSGGRQAGRGAARFHHDSFQRALPQLADDEPHEEVLLLGSGTREQLAEQARALAPGAFALHLPDRGEGRVDLGQRRRVRWRGFGTCRPQRGKADRELPLADVTA